MYRNPTHIARLTLTERLANARYFLDTMTAATYSKHKAAIVKRAADEVYALTVQLQNMR